MKILVTGGAGFIGSHLCDRLLNEGHTVVCLDYLSDYYDPKIKIMNVFHNFNHPNFIFLVKNVMEKDKLEKIFQKYPIDVVIHLAARAGVRASLEEPLQFRDTNVVGTINLLELSKIFKVKHFIFGSSSSVYGDNKKVPFTEDDLVDWPISPYATSKRACELYCYNYHYICGLNTTILRFFNVFGPRNRPDMAHFTFTQAIDKGLPIKKFGDGSSSRDYTFIEDIIEGIVKTLKKPLGFEIINLGNSHPITLNTMIATLEKALGKKAVIQETPLQLGDVEKTYADISKAKKILGWEPKTSYEDGVKKLVAWYKTAHSS
ncbi:MAG: GDP-mannose 4,6-dehydratase [Candidatus Komeilibacteria bacterium]|nr:GDP-mannose 4,6-dehydratase [Candidatus Komeilibacteria bacterium]